MSSSPVSEFRDRGIRLLPIDPLLLLAVLGLTAASLYVVGTATQDDIPGDPNYYLVRQAGYAGVGHRAHARSSRASTTRGCASGRPASTG